MKISAHVREWQKVWDKLNTIDYQSVKELKPYTTLTSIAISGFLRLLAHENILSFTTKINKYIANNHCGAVKKTVFAYRKKKEIDFKEIISIFQNKQQKYIIDIK